MHRFRTQLLATSVLILFGLTPVAANPLGSQVVGGSATVQGQGTSSVTVTQQSNSAIINWNTFNIGTGEKTNIVMPSASSVQLDRVTGGLGPSQISGSLSSNGRVFLVNPDGILFGSGAIVNTGGLLATTHDIANADFMAGRYNFSIPGNPSASVVNQGTITAQSGGFAALVAPGVRNSGTITATLGIVTLASGNSFTLDFYGDKLITLGVKDSIAATVKDVATGQPLNSLITNAGKLSAKGGRVELTAAAARTVVDSVINTSGVIEANTIGTHHGMIVLSAATDSSKPAGAPRQTVKVSGKLSAAGKNKGETGGTIQITGEAIEVTSAKINASGVAGGGTVLIGGDTGGGNPDPAVASIPQAQLQPYAVLTASTVTVDAATIINASATVAGDGGKVVVWSDGTTTFNGTIMATGGTLAGNGGFVETSGHVLSFADGRVDTSAPYGRTGSWLLDPFDLTIDSAAAATIATSLATTNVTIQTTASGSSGPGVPNPSGNGDIFVNSGISWGSANSLTLSAYRNIAVGANITNTGGAAVNLRADNTGSGVGTVSFGRGVQVSTAGPVSIFYNPSVNPAGSVVNTTSYVNPTENFTGNVTGGGALTAYMLVNSVYDLQNIQNSLTGSYALGKDIDASATVNWNGGVGFDPIKVFPVAATFDGQNHTIDRLTIKSALDSVGLFGQNFGTIRNVGLTNVDIAPTTPPPFSLTKVGAIAGSSSGSIINSFATGVLNGTAAGSAILAGGLVGQTFGGQIVSSFASVTVTGPNGNSSCALNCAVGGLVGSNIGTIISSYATGTIVGGTNTFAGGLAGTNISNPGASAIITGSYATGNVSAGANSIIGGLVGQNGDSIFTSSVSSSFASGAVSSSTSVAGGVTGGLVGYNYRTISQSYAAGLVSTGITPGTGGLVGQNLGTISQSFASGAVSSTGSTVGGLVGYDSGIITQSFAVGSVRGRDNVGGLVGTVVGGSVAESYATGLVSSTNGTASGGLVGSGAGIGGGVSTSYWDTQFTGQPTSAGGIGMTTGQLITALPSGFDPAVWTIKPGVSYPYLRWQSAATIPIPPFVPITVTADNLFKVYGTADPTLTYHITAGSLSGSDAFSGTLARTPGQNVGTYSITLGTLSLPSMYTLTYVGGTLTITPATLTITADSTSRQVGAANPTFTASYSGFVAGDGPSVVSGLTLSTPATTSSPVGTYPIIPNGASARNYNINYVNGVLTLAPSPITVTADTLSKVYGTIDPALTYHITSGSLSGSDAFSGTLARTPGQNVGTYSITLGTLSLPPMYTLTYVGGTLTITPATLTITADSTSRQAGAANPTFTASYNGFVAGDGPSVVSGLTLSTPATTSSPVGTYPIIPNGASALNYSISYVNGVLTLTSAPTPPPPPTPVPTPLPPPTPPASVLSPPPPPITQIAQLIPPINNAVTTPAPILASLTLPSSPVGSLPSGTGSSLSATPGKPGFIPPPLPRRLVPGPNGEMRSSVPPPGENRFFRDQVLLQLELNIPDAELARIVQQLGLRIITSDTMTTLGRKVVRLELPRGLSVRNAILQLEANRLISVAAPVYQFRLLQAAAAISKGDPAQYMIGDLHLDKAHTIASGKGVIVALIDSMVDKRHTELLGAISEELDTLDVKELAHSHGTAMAGAIVSHSRLLGVAPGAKILAVQAFGMSKNTAEGTTLSILKGIEWAMSQGARVINMSFAGPRDPSLERALKAAHEKGIVLIAAAGNAGPKSPPLYPGADPNVIAVTATDIHDQLFRGANQGPQVSVAAPGVDILAPAPEEAYQMTTGTSIATAHVSGVVALMLERDPTLKPDDVRRILEATAIDLGPKGKDNQFGWGLVNPEKALEAIDARLKSSNASSKSR